MKVVIIGASILTMAKSFQSLLDRVAAFFGGGIRIRISFTGPVPNATLFGDIPGRPKAEDIRKIVLRLDPASPGVVHVRHPSPKVWKISVTGPLKKTGFEQRLRNHLTSI